MTMSITKCASFLGCDHMSPSKISNFGFLAGTITPFEAVHVFPVGGNQSRGLEIWQVHNTTALSNYCIL